VSTPQPLPLRIARRNDTDPPPPGKFIPSISATADSQEVMNGDKCPYPTEARNRVETGTVVLLVYVMPDGTAPNPQIDTTSGSDSLDQAAITCIRDNGRFQPKLVGNKAMGYWARTKFRWSFGD
jgi:TonB family protein